ncbi:hemolysin family protein [Paenibacillus sp. J5C_2022]|uniref:hemolysin family protein n=1 Tax=Paenibacillus sp. J5C2022 TaxID=2977129 RepID=UPI0021CE2B76|nr:hemolysin family protein [Paenibacillus sp. J5C2022]MCU6712594.1 hemolysin family protein [Paenibacillus sp. J5C2022]
MEGIPLPLLLTLGALILLSAFFSSAETAFSSVNKIRLRNYVDEKKPGSKKALGIVENFDNALSTILVGNNIVNIAAASISAKVSVDLFGPSAGLIFSTFGMTVLILIFGEILPKSFAKEHAESYSLKISGIMFLLITVLTPVNFIFSKLRSLVSRVFSKGEKNNLSVTEEEIKVMVEISEEEGVIDKEEKELVHRSLEFNDILVGEALTPRPDMVAVEVGQSIEDIKQAFLDERFSRIPVYENDIDNIIGILSERDFFAALLQDGDANVRELIRKPKFVVKSMKISALMLELQKSNVHMSIVIDEFGGTSGLITLEDILEQLVGEIWDEHDEVIDMVTQLDDRTYEMSPQLTLDEFAKIVDIPPIESSFHNLGGWVFGNIDRIPHKGDSFQYEHLLLTVIEVEKKRIKRIRVDVNEREEFED